MPIRLKPPGLWGWAGPEYGEELIHVFRMPSFSKHRTSRTPPQVRPQFQNDPERSNKNNPAFATALKSLPRT